MRNRRKWLATFVLAAAALTLIGFQLGHRLTHPQNAKADELEWLASEFQVDAPTLAKIRELHAGYVPTCRQYCAKIATAQSELAALLADDAAMSDAAGQKLAEIGALRAQCQAAMLRHFDEVSQAMPPEQGKRYLAEMRRLTVGAHEHIERRMSGSPPAVHDHH